MKWIITRDYISDGDLPSREGKGNAAPGEIPEPHVRFRLLDDDGEVYYEGIANQQEFDDADQDAAFAPLNWAMADAGCTEMQYKENGPWTTL